MQAGKKAPRRLESVAGRFFFLVLFFVEFVGVQAFVIF